MRQRHAVPEQARRSEDEQREQQLDDKHHSAARNVHGARRQVHPVGAGVRQARCFVMHGERGERPPLGAAREQLDEARGEHEAHEQPAQQPARRCALPAAGGKQHAERAGLEQQQIPLKARPAVAVRLQRVVARPEQRVRHCASPHRAHAHAQRRQRCPARHQRLQRRIGAQWQCCRHEPQQSPRVFLSLHTSVSHSTVCSMWAGLGDAHRGHLHRRHAVRHVEERRDLRQPARERAKINKRECAEKHFSAYFVLINLNHFFLVSFLLRCVCVSKERKGRARQRTHTNQKSIATMSAIERFAEISKKNYKDQCAWFLNAWWSVSVAFDRPSKPNRRNLTFCLLFVVVVVFIFARVSTCLCFFLYTKIIKI